MKFLHIGEFLYSTRMLALHIVFVRKKAVIKDRLGSALALSADISVRYLKTAFNALERIPVMMLMEALETAYSAFSIVPVMHTCFIAIDAESFDEAVLTGMSASRTVSAVNPRKINCPNNWASRIRTGECRDQNPVPYRLAMAHHPA